jgi:hypothetical protein
MGTTDPLLACHQAAEAREGKSPATCGVVTVTNEGRSSITHAHLTTMRLPCLLLLSAVAAPLAAQADVDGRAHTAAISSFAGKWHLDVAQSRDLPGFYAGLRDHQLDIAQDDSSLTVDVTLVDTAAVAQRMRFPYNLLRPVRTTTQVRSPRGPMEIPTTLTATPRADSGLQISIARELTIGDRVLRPFDRETWHLSPDGAQLLIDREAEMPGPSGMRTIHTHYVFVRR